MQNSEMIDRLIKPVVIVLKLHGIQGRAFTDIYSSVRDVVANCMTVAEVLREQLTNANARIEAEKGKVVDDGTGAHHE